MNALPVEQREKIVPLIPLHQENKLTPKQRQALALLSEGRSCQEAADAVKVALRTVQRWRTEPMFNAEFKKLNKEYIEKCTADKPITDEEIDAVSRRSLIAGIARDPKLAFEYRKARGLITAIEKDTSEEVFTIQIGVLPKAEAEVEELLKEVPPPVNLEPQYKPKI